jgi:hypothetical protein
MPDDNVIKFRPAPKKKPAATQPAGTPSVRVAVIVALIAIAVVATISWWFGGIH